MSRETTGAFTTFCSWNMSIDPPSSMTDNADSEMHIGYNKETKGKSWTNPNVLAKPALKDAVAKPKDAVAAAKATATPVAAGSGDSKDVKAATSKTPTIPAALSAGKTAVSGTSHPPASSTHPSAPTPAVESSREIGAVVPGHGTVPDEHVTVQVKSKKTNWKGALDVAVKVLDSAMERAKKGENLTKNAGHNPPVVKDPIAPKAHHDNPAQAPKEVPHPSSKGQEPPKAAPAKVSKAINAHASKDASPQVTAKEAPRPKAASKLSWKSPFKKHAASPPPAAHGEARSIGRDDEDESAGAA